jgi:aryl-alcohol dehydrogenase-like predicted oxidoreductase
MPTSPDACNILGSYLNFVQRFHYKNTIVAYSASQSPETCDCFYLHRLNLTFLTGKIDENATFDSSDFRSTLPRFTPEALKANQALIDLLGSIAAQKQATPAQLAIAWLLAQKPWIVPIPGTTKRHRLEENIGAASVELTPDDLRAIDDAASRITVQGARYPEKLEQMTGR